MAAGQPVPGRPEASTEQRGDRGTPPNGSSTDSSSADPAGEKPRTPGDPPPEADPKSEKEPESGKTEVGSPAGEGRDHDDADPAQTGDGGPEAEKPGQPKAENPRQDEGERGNDDRGSKTDQPEPGKAEGQNGGKDNGSAPDDPASSEQPSTGPSEASQFPPGSRRASLAAARERQLEGAEELRAIFEDAQTTNGPGERTTGESGDSGAPPQSENAGSDGRGPEAQPQGTDTPPGAPGDGDTSNGGNAAGGSDAPSGRDQPAPVTPGVEAEPPAQETPRPQDQEQEPPLPQDSSGSGNDSGDPPADPPTDGSPPADDQPRDDKDGTPPGSEVDEPTDPVTETGPAAPEPGREATPKAPETTDQGTEPPEPKADDGTTGDETDNPKPVDETTPPPDGTGENVAPPEAPGEQSDGHGRNAEDPQSIEPTDETDPPDNEAELSGERDGSGTELAPHQEESTDVEPSRFSGRVTITLDRDGRPLPPEHPDADTETPGRGELRRPEDDRASRDYQERKPDKLSRLRGELKKFVDRSDDTKEFVDKFSAPAQKTLERVKPTGQSCGARLNTDHIKAPDEKIKAGDTVLGAVGTVIILTEIVRFGINIARNSRRREHADH
ncbi:hypothetical protein BKA00_002877 [Actinomadura coerulea]|uniref:Uncharacterized protein n=1 Tax=Actinomadura coerulea TaxID=46159 RepID=A0A7X0FY74_9ACTN|nr:hypothetical protein [Actinomadura coerulea]MBB6395963.1 hypothetical protein [Actinomadura coerulea]